MQFEREERDSSNVNSEREDTEDSDFLLIDRGSSDHGEKKQEDEWSRSSVALSVRIETTSSLQSACCLLSSEKEDTSAGRGSSTSRSV